MTDTRYDRRPILQIDCGPGENLGNCYNRYSFVVRSNKPLIRKQFDDLRAAGFLGYGQEWSYSEGPSEEMCYTPHGSDWRGKPYSEVKMPVWVYYVTDLVDSSD